MKSKMDRLSDSIVNMEAAIKYYLKYAEGEYYAHKLPRSDYIKLVKNFKDISLALDSLKLDNAFENDKLNQIRAINLSINNLYEEGDYNALYMEMLNTNNNLCKGEKAKDRKKLGELKKAFNNLSNFYQYRLRKAVADPSQGLHFKDKKLDNFQFINDYYLIVKYNFRKIKFELLGIGDSNQELLGECTRVIDENKDNEDIKNRYTSIRDCILNYAKAEVVIQGLIQTKELCNGVEFANISKKVDELLNKYQKIYLDNMEKYNNEYIFDLEKSSKSK